MNRNFSNLKVGAIVLSATLSIGAATTFAQDTMQTPTAAAQSRSVSSGQKAKIRGVVTDRQSDTLTVRDETGSNVQVKLTSGTSIKSKKFFGSGKSYVSDLLTRGLYLEVQGRGDETGALVADKVRFGEDDLRAAQAIEARVTPVEGRLGEAEQNAQRLSGQLDELTAVSNAARGGARAAQDTADAAVQGVNATNQRISDLDDYVVQTTSVVNFKVGSAVLSPEAKTQLDQIAQGIQAAKGFVVEVTGYADASGNSEKNRLLSERRANAVRSYLVEEHAVPLRRVLQSYGYGESQAVAENTTREGRAQNRRVEVKLLVSRGVNQSVTVSTPAATEPTQTPQEQ